MTRATLLRAAAMVATISVAGSAQIQTPTLCTNTAPTLKSFLPQDSLFLNSTATTFTIKLVNTVSGCPTEYRVSRFSDFHDATWTTYSASPSTVLQRTWFPPVSGGSTSIMLYFQVRVKNPQGGFPASATGGTVTTQPMFFTSEPLSRKIRLMYFG
jgi:hypothetical protein